MAGKKQTEQTVAWRVAGAAYPEASQTVSGSELPSPQRCKTVVFRLREPLAPLLFSSRDILGDP